MCPATVIRNSVRKSVCMLCGTVCATVCAECVENFGCGALLRKSVLHPNSTQCHTLCTYSCDSTEIPHNATHSAWHTLHTLLRFHRHVECVALCGISVESQECVTIQNHDTRWRRHIECLNLQVIFRKRATIYRTLA